MLVLDIENGIDPMLAQQQPETILETVSGQKSSIMAGLLAVHVKFGRPPGFGSVFEFRPVSNEGIDAGRPPDHRVRRHFQIAGFLQVMVVSNHVRIVLRPEETGSSNG